MRERRKVKVRSLAGAGSFRGLKVVGVLLVGLLAGVLLVGLLAGGKPADAQVGNESSQNPRDLDRGCRAHRVPVEITEVEYEIYGELCLPKGGAPKTVQLLLHGITYGTYYWDFPYQSERYSYVDYMNKAGYATFNIDRIGIGRSDHPPSAQVTLDTNAMVASQLVDKLKKGEIGNKKFEKVIYVGHSYGTATSWLAQSEYDAGTDGYPAGADAIIGTGWGHVLQRDPRDRFFTEQYPVESDPKFATDGAVYVGQYLTPRPPPYLLDYNQDDDNERDKDYLYYLYNVDPKVLELDAEYKQTVTQEELDTFENRFEDTDTPEEGTTEKIRVPVFQINGNSEIFFCGGDDPPTDPAWYCGDAEGLTEFEGQFFDPKACFTGAITPAAGHDLNLHLNARTTYNTAKKFADMAIGPNGGKAREYATNCKAPDSSKNDPGPSDPTP